MNISKALQIFFTPDVNVKWHEPYKCYMLNPLNDTGKAWIKRYPALKTDRGMLLHEDSIEQALKNMGTCGLFYELDIEDTRDIIQTHYTD